MESFPEFIIRNENADTARLLLARDRYPDIDMSLAASTIEVRKKLRRKVPAWYSCPGLVYPRRLSGEQCSSEMTARYKAALALSLHEEDIKAHRDGGDPGGDATDAGKARPRIADLTGGLGVDSWAFSAVAEAVLYNEMDRVLADAAEKNFNALGCTNISVSSLMLASESGHGDKTVSPEEISETFHPDIIFLDPARRDGDGSKVFLPEQCSPDIIGLKDSLLRACRHVMVKLSPMADISMLLDRLGRECRQLHILEYGGECKEIIAVLDRDFSGECSILAASAAGPDSWSAMTFSPTGIAEAAPVTMTGYEMLSCGAVLFEPGKGLMKAGAFNLLCRMFPMKKLGISTHYYILSDKSLIDSRLKYHGKFYSIIGTAPLNNRNIKDFGKKYPHCEVTARNIRMDSDTLRKKLGTSGGGTEHVFGLRCDLPSGPENILIAAVRI